MNGKNLKNNTILQKLYVSNNFLTSSAMVAFNELLIYNTALISVSLSGCGINDDGIRCIHSGLMKNSTLKYLDISDNHITLLGMKLIVESLFGNYTILQIEWENNDFTKDGDAYAAIETISDLLERNNY